MAKPVKKMHFWGLWIPLILIFAFVILPVGMTVLIFYDGSHIETGVTEKQSDAKVFGTIMTDMFDGCRKEEDQTIDLKITQKQLNQLLYNASSSFQGNQFLKQFAVVIEDKSYEFDLEIDAYNVFKTHLTIETTVSTKEDLGEGLGKGFYFDITELRAGRLTDIESVLPWLVNTVGLDLSTLFQNAGLSIVSDLDNLALKYPYKAFIEDFSKRSGTTDPLFMNIFSNFLVNDLINFSHVPESHTVGIIDMNPYKSNDLYTNSDKVIDFTVGEEEIPLLNAKCDEVQLMINDGIIDNDSKVTEHARTVLKYLAFGQDFLSKSEKSYLEGIYSKIQAQYCLNMSIEDYSAMMKGAVFGDTTNTIMDKITSNVDGMVGSLTDEEKKDIINDLKAGEVHYFRGGDSDEDPIIIDDNEIHKLTKANKNLVGYGFTFVGEKDDGTDKLAYAILDNVYPTVLPAGEGIEKDSLSLTFGLNINGCRTSLIMPMEGADYHDYEGHEHGLVFDVTDAPLYFGTADFPGLKDEMKEVINSAGNDDSSMIQFEKNSAGEVEAISISFDFDTYFDKHSDSNFTKFNARAESEAGAYLIVEFDYCVSEGSVAGKRAGEFAISIGYQQMDI